MVGFSQPASCEDRNLRLNPPERVNKHMFCFVVYLPRRQAAPSESRRKIGGFPLSKLIMPILSCAVFVATLSILVLLVS